MAHASRGKIRRSGQDRVFDTVVVVLLMLAVLCVLYPMWFTLIASVSNPYAVSTGRVIFWLEGFTLEPYQNVLRNSQVWTGYLNTIINTSIVTLYNLALTIPCAYVLSRRCLAGRKIIMTYFLITMYFSGGMIPSYLLVKNLQLVNTRWALILPAGFSVYNMIIARTFFQTTFEQEIYDATAIDGASEFRTFFSIILPLSGAIVAVIALYVAVGHWNSYFSALLYLDDKSLFPLQYVLRNILSGEESMAIGDLSSMQQDEVDALLRRHLMAQSMKYSLVLISSLPMIVAYPFVQKYFVKGVMVGAIKG